MTHDPGRSPIGVMLLEYGEPQTLNDVKAYLTFHYGGRVLDLSRLVRLQCSG